MPKGRREIYEPAFTLCRQEQKRDTIRKFKTLLDEEEKRKIPVLGLITIFGAFLEMLGVSMAVPLVTAILGKGRETALKYIVLMVLGAGAICFGLALLFLNWTLRVLGFGVRTTFKMLSGSYGKLLGKEKRDEET